MMETVSYYLTLKTIHIIAIISWMAGLLYYPRLLAYHCNAQNNSEMYQQFLIMEKRLMSIIMIPAAIISLLTGILLINFIGFGGGWLHTKIMLVAVLFFCHGLMMKFGEDFANGKNKRSSKFYKIFNEAPTLIMIAIIYLVIFKPF